MARVSSFFLVFFLLDIHFHCKVSHTHALSYRRTHTYRHTSCCGTHRRTFSFLAGAMRRLVDLYSCNYSATISQPLTTQLDLSPGLRMASTNLPSPFDNHLQSGAVQRCSVLLRPSTATCKVLPFATGLATGAKIGEVGRFFMFCIFFFFSPSTCVKNFTCR